MFRPGRIAEESPTSPAQLPSYPAIAGELLAKWAQAANDLTHVDAGSWLTNQFYDVLCSRLQTHPTHTHILL